MTDSVCRSGDRDALGSRLLPGVLIRVLPVAIAALCVIWYSAQSSLQQIVHDEMQLRITTESHQAATAVARRISGLVDTATTLAQNQLVIQGVTKPDEVPPYVPQFFQNLTLPGAADAKICLIDLRGHAVASNDPTHDYSGEPWVERVIRGESWSRTSLDGIVLAVPVKRQSVVIGCLVVKLDRVALREYIGTISSEEAVLVVDARDRIVTSTQPERFLAGDHLPHPQDDSLLVSTPVAATDNALRVCVIENQQRSSQQEFGLRRRLLAELVLSLTALVCGIVLTGRLVTRPVLKLVDEVQRVNLESPDWHGIRESGPAEIRSLARSFNQVMQNLRETTVSREALNATNSQLQRAQAMAEQANQSKSDFLANMSHEIRTPMTAILGYTDLLMEQHCQPEVRDYLEVVQRNGQHLLTIINDILDLSKIEAGRMELELIHCSPPQILEDVFALMEVRAAQKGIRLEVQLIAPMPASIISDPTRLRQILINLVGNAIKFTEHGSVKVVAGYVADRRQLRIDVTDSGIGMSRDQVAKLFRPFTQADATTTRRFGGTGLGLTISKHLAELLGGGIEVESTPNVGSTFSVTLASGLQDDEFVPHVPVSSRQDKEITIPDKARPSQLPAKCRILLAEDGPDNQRLIKHVLEKAGANVDVVSDGRQAVDLVMANESCGQPYDMVITDMQMPVMDGYQAVKELRSRGFPRPIVALTASAMAGDREKCLEAGCDDYTSKPIDRVKLIRTVFRNLVPDESVVAVPFRN